MTGTVLGRSLNVELHCHTHYSIDGMIHFDSMLRTAAQRGLDAIAITDHDTIAGALEFRARTRQHNSPLEIIIGEERTLADGTHLIGLFLQHAISSTSLLDAVAEIREQRGICVIPHPFRPITGLFTTTSEPLLKDVCFELFNSKCTLATNAAAGTLLERNWLPVGGSDAHVEADLGKAVNRIPYRLNVENSVRAALSGLLPFDILGIAQKANTHGTWRNMCRETAYRLYRRTSRVAPRLARYAYRSGRNSLASQAFVLELKTSHLPDQLSSVGATDVSRSRVQE